MMARTGFARNRELPAACDCALMRRLPVLVSNVDVALMWIANAKSLP
ncbi:MAG TPA: hypothetical protein GXX24_02285 [Paracoccus solventivorans]|uniref:Uncharacterized protein n=1 Tax=Paracoccus solventivorans TaxID=53463 RepID=A0A832PKL1_9RHOB|nr:hypothetical protein [Paracoccus solventivorans]